MSPNEVRLRLLRSSDVPATNPHNLAFRFGLQDTKGNLVAGTEGPDNAISFDFTLKVKEGSRSDRPIFAGRFASGTAGDRFVYLSWWAIERGHWINRVKARLATIDWKIVRAAQEQDRPVTADMTGWLPGDARKYVSWYLD
jgi:hypothetical protein